MSNKLEKIKVSKGMTLETLASSLEISTQELRRYHNTYCPLEDLIEIELPRYLKEVFVPSKDAKFKISNDFKDDFIRYKSKGALSNKYAYTNKYGIVQEFHENGEKKSNIHYKINLNKFKNQVTIVREKFYINNALADTFATELGSKISEVMHPLKLSLDNAGGLESVLNHEEIKKRWLDEKVKLKHYYKGEVSDKLLNNVESTIFSNKGIQYSLDKSLFYKLFFIPLYHVFEENNYTFNIDLPVLSNQLLPYEVTLSLDMKSLSNHKFTIQAQGKCVDKRTIEQIGQGKLMPVDLESDVVSLKSDFYFRYRINSRNNSILSISGGINIDLVSHKKKIVFNCHQIKK